MRHTAHRLLRLIALLQARRHWSGAELAERMGVDRRSIRRDIERLRELGYPIQASAGVGGGYRLGAGAPVLPMLLDEEEATTLAIALRAASATVAGIDDTARGLLSKLDPLVPSRRRQQAGEVHAATATLSDLPKADARLLGQLAQACRQAARLAFDYRSGQDVLTQREVEAQHLINYGRRWYLLAWDLGRQDWRTLRVDRMGPTRTLRVQGVHRRTPAPPAVMVRQAVSQSPFRLQAVMRLAGPLAELSRTVPPWCGVLEADGPDHCLLRVGADSTGMMLAQILGLDQVPLALWTTPPALKAQLAQRLAGLGTLFGDDGEG
ncbi:WYL domain-containing protein [Stenotrophomonas sp. 24(2023)]|uniref:helix-turn-helix transcriptional regulator n=1 Tax=Stenotrophomonas sp. 24(2023) TaxID=3068324 RepID=UPI0027E15777|nr:WYL domain-containing protein [Stenotrophomonas sp. 24(2023)]WMJ68584.1 WYL domain-containing protein [Stenotrophomonas sp. 24(2023)]